MTWQTILYFTSILLTCGLTGFLAWYAWRQPALPGVRTYAWLAFGECLMALTDVISMLSGTQAQALFWFNLRFFFTATIPVIWLAFALAYGGQQGWLSKKLLAGAFVIPVITQVMLWSNSLHGLWVKHEVGFHQSGPFWIAETGARVPGLWFMVHSFYSLILLLAGIVLIFLTAWRMRREQRGQAFLLAGGALVALTTTLIPTFNLLPQAEFNPFIPGIGISALLYALAIFRFQFLKRLPAQESAARSTNLDTQEKRSLAIFIFIFILFASGIAAISYVSYQRYKSQFRTQVNGQLTAIAELKVNQLENWRLDRMADAEAFYNNPAFATFVQRSLENPGDTQAEAQLQAWLDAIRNSYHYDRVFLLDAQAVERISSPAISEPVSAYLVEQTAAALASGHVTFLDFHRDTPDGPIYLSLLVPIFADQQPGHPLGLLVLRIDPNVSLYPFIQQWPTPSATAETLLVRRDGNDVLFLNELKFEQNTALNLRIPLEDTQVLAVKAILGQTGIMEGVDYRGVAVIGYARAVPDTPWFLVARMDTAEVYAPLRERLWQMVLFFGVLIAAAGTGLMLVWRRQRVRYYREQIEAAEALHESEEKLRTALDILPLGVSVLNADRKIVYTNPALSKILNMTEEGLAKGDFLKRKYLKADGTSMSADEFASMRAIREQKIIYNVETGVVKEDGNIVWTEVSAIPAPFSDWKVVIVTADITERKQAEQVLQEYNTRLETEVAERTHELRDAHEKLVRQERLAVLGQLAGSVGHELRNPLGVISNAVYFLKMTQPDANNTIKEYLDIIENETRTSDKIVTDLLDFTRIKSVDREPVAVSELIHHALERYPVPPSVKVVLELPADLPPVYADPHHVVQVLGNLTVNACQAMPEVGRLTLSATAQDGMILIKIQDTGIGIPPENMSKLFEPLFTTKIRGIGLGLAVSQKLAEANGGRIEVQSEPGKGSTFTVYMPVYRS